jgi:hypothetical protein
MSLTFKFVSNFKKNTENVSSLNGPFHILRNKHYKISLYRSNRFSKIAITIL